MHTNKGTKRLSFELNPNNKLLCPYFICVLPKKKVKSSQRFDIRISDRHFCYADVVSKKTVTLHSICDNSICISDMGYEPKQYREYMGLLYSTKKWWKSDDTEFDVIVFKKVIQLDMFA